MKTFKFSRFSLTSDSYWDCILGVKNRISRTKRILYRNAHVYAEYVQRDDGFLSKASLKFSSCCYCTKKESQVLTYIPLTSLRTQSDFVSFSADILNNMIGGATTQILGTEHVTYEEPQDKRSYTQGHSFLLEPVNVSTTDRSCLARTLYMLCNNYYV